MLKQHQSISDMQEIFDSSDYFNIPYFILNKMVQDGFSSGGLIYFGIMFAFPSICVSGLGGSIFEDSFGTFITKIIKYSNNLISFFTIPFTITVRVPIFYFRS